MLHKGKLQAALNFKRGQFTAYDSSFIDQLQAYRHALETLYLRYPSAAQLEHVLPPDGSGMPPAGAPSTIEFDCWKWKRFATRWNNMARRAAPATRRIVPWSSSMARSLFRSL